MKTCPVCKARCFDDMEICYGCMHRFEEAPPVRNMPDEGVGNRAVPERADASAPIDPTGASRETPERRRTIRREAPRVFGALDADDQRPMPDAGFADARFASDSLSVDASQAARLEIMTGPLAVAPLGNDYRLVVSIERT